MFFRGSSALSGFRTQKLLAGLRLPVLQGVEARWVHLVDVTTELTTEDARRLEALLTYGPRDLGGGAIDH